MCTSQTVGFLDTDTLKVIRWCCAVWINTSLTHLFTTRNPATLVSCHLSVCPDDVISLSL